MDRNVSNHIPRSRKPVTRRSGRSSSIRTTDRNVESMKGMKSTYDKMTMWDLPGELIKRKNDKSRSVSVDRKRRGSTTRVSGSRRGRDREGKLVEMIELIRHNNRRRGIDRRGNERGPRGSREPHKIRENLSNCETPSKRPESEGSEGARRGNWKVTLHGTMKWEDKLRHVKAIMVKPSLA